MPDPSPSTPTSPTPQAVDFIQPPSILNMGAPGSGKTWILHTFPKKGIKLFSIITEPGGVDSLLDACRKNSVDMNLVHWHYVPPVTPGWDALKQAATMSNTMSYEDLSKVKYGIARDKTNGPIMRLFWMFENMEDQRTGQLFGPVEKLGDKWAVCLDSLSGLNIICRQNVVGFKPSPHQGEWGTMMGLEEDILLHLSADLTSYFILNCHLDRVSDEVTLSNKVVCAALGSKLGPRIPRFFGDHIFSLRSEKGFTWSTLSNDADLKNRILEPKKELVPDYAVFVDGYQARLEAARKVS